MTGKAAARDGAFFSPEEMEEIRRAFFDQAREAVEDLDRGVLALENRLPGLDTFRPLKRSAHTLKGDCASVGFPALSTLAHALEDGLAGLERRRREVSSEEVDVLLRAVDALRGGIERGARGEPEAALGAWIGRLRDLATPSGEASPGLVPVYVTLSCGRSPRATEAALDRVVRRLGLEVLERETRPGAHGRSSLRVTALSPSAAESLRAAARAARLRLEIEDCPSSPAAAPEAATARGDAPGEGETVRVEAARVDQVLTLVGEMVIARSAIDGVAAEVEAWLPPDQATRLSDAQALLGRALQDLQRSAMRMRMVPADRIFRRFVRVVHDLGRRTGKKLRLRIEGETTELDRGILETLEEPLLHLVRNAADHGLEAPADRAAAGKPEEGSITLRAGREGNQVLIEVADDGRGIDAAAVRARALERGLVEAVSAQDLTDDEARQLVFLPGLSTAREVTETSGRGVGLDVVRDTVESLKGSVSAQSMDGCGASFLIRVPLTVAIIRALLFRAGGRSLAVPLSSVVEIARLDDLARQRVGEREVFRLRDEVLALVPISGTLGLSAVEPGCFVIVVQCGAGRFGLLVDRLDGEHELVIKAVHDQWIRTPLVAGASVLAGGGLVLILDVPAVYRTALRHGGQP